ncbi:WD40 repeat domain-containing serine/threonine protein kinase [Frigoriglobus tundricola]|nr:serine/threonine-protein kinase [Frigoriglobus tundricola]
MSAPAPVPATSTDLLSLVRKSGVLDEKQFSEHFSDPGELPDDPTECANALIRSGLLTTFQARQILAGKYRGLVLGAYKILRPLGQGGMGVVYLGEHTTLHRRVALKVLPAKSAQERVAVERFMREARATAALDHPNIVRLHDVCQGAGVHFLVMELVEGKNLETLLAETGPLHFATAVSYIAQAAAGLQHAHSKGIVHRDIKPANLMMTKDGGIKILDMGLARSFVNESDNLTGALGEEGEALGTIDFVAPEQAMAQAVDERADLYSLGATLYCLLAGHPPYKGSRAQVLMQHQMAPPPQLSRTLKVNVPQTLNDVIAKMMAKKKGDRYQSADEVIDALSPWLPAPKSSSNVQQNALSTQDLREAGVATQVSRSQTKKGKKSKKRAAARADRKKWYAIGGGAAAVLVVGVLIAVLSGGKKAVTAEGTDAPGRSGTVSNRPAAAGEDSQLVLTSTGLVPDVTLSRDGTRFAAVDWTGNLIYGRTANWQKLESIRVQAGATLNCCAGTPDGRHIVVAGRGTPVFAYDWGTGQMVREFPGHSGSTLCVAVSRSGKLLTCGSDGAIVLYDFATGDVIRKYEGVARQVWSVAFSPDESKFVATTAAGGTDEESNQIRLWDVATGGELQRFTGHTDEVRWATFSPNGQTLASASFDGTVRLWDVAGGKQTRVIDAHAGKWAERVAFLPDGKRLASCGSDARNTASSELRVWDVATGQEVRTWRGDDARGLIAMALSPDGKYAVTGSRDKAVRLWKFAF